MPRTRDRATDPSPVPLCPRCHDPILPTQLSMAEHRVCQAEWDLAHLPISKATLWVTVIDAYRKYVPLLRAFTKLERERLNGRIVDLEIDLGARDWDLKVACELVDDLKADVASLEEGRHG